MVDGAEAGASKPSMVIPGETLPESHQEGRETERGPSETEPLADKRRDPAVDRDRDLGGRIAGGGNGGGSSGKIAEPSPPGT